MVRNLKKKIRVMASGVFDLLHTGHLFYLTECKKLGDELTVVIARDSTVKKLKNRPPIIPETNRLQMVQALKPVDEAILGSETDPLETVEKIKPNIIALGPDQSWSETELEVKLKARGLSPKIVRIEKREISQLSSTSKIVEKILKRGK
ncbi:MAG: FAD synthase [Euryarchaeota archaeon]|nr:FAD synthase [Euryarchaeota archaeon]